MNKQLFLKGILLSLTLVVGIVTTMINSPIYIIIGSIITLSSISLMIFYTIKFNKEIHHSHNQLKNTNIMIVITSALLLGYVLVYFIKYLYGEVHVFNYITVLQITPMLACLFGLLVQKRKIMRSL